MYYVYIDDCIAGEFASPVTAQLYAEQLRRCGHEDVHVDRE